MKTAFSSDPIVLCFDASKLSSVLEACRPKMQRMCAGSFRQLDIESDDKGNVQEVFTPLLYRVEP